jgi:hypothetical protein
MPQNGNQAASATVTSEQNEVYVPIYSDCLSDAVNVLQAYGLSGLPSDVTDPYPNNYYNSLQDFEFYSF